MQTLARKIGILASRFATARGIKNREPLATVSEALKQSAANSKCISTFLSPDGIVRSFEFVANGVSKKRVTRSAWEKNYYCEEQAA